MGTRSIGLRLAPLVLVLSLALGACGLSTDTVATVGGERISRGEVNSLLAESRPIAAQSGQTVTAADLLPYLINIRLIELAARERKITVSDTDVDAEIARQLAPLGQQGATAAEQRLTTLSTNTLGQLRPIVNSGGGQAIPNGELDAAIRAEIARLRGMVRGGKNEIAVGPAAISPEMIRDEAIVFRNALAGLGVAVMPASLEPIVSNLIQQLGTGQYEQATVADQFQTYLQSTGETEASFRRSVRVQLLVTKLLPAEVDAAYFQTITTDSAAKAAEVVQKARAGTPFSDLLRTYQIASVPTNGPDNLTTGSYPVDSLPANVRAAFRSFTVGEVSEPLPTADGKQFNVLRIARIERRAPTSDESNAAISPLLDQLRAKYPVVYVDKSLETIPVP